MSASSTDSATGTATSSAPSGSNSSNDSSSGGNITNSASLYLYTFLATLVLLLGVSAAIVVRSLILRRRHRRMIEEAIRNGTYVPPNVLANSRGRIDPAKKPKLWEAAVFESEWKGKEGEWSDILPVSASISSWTPPGEAASNANTDTNANGTANGNGGDTSAVARPSTLHTIARAPARLAVGAFRLISPGPNARPRADAEANPTASNSNSNSNASELKRPHQVLPNPTTTVPTHMEVAVLIAMPGALMSKERERDEDEEIPHVEVGTTEVVIAPRASGLIAGLQEGSSSGDVTRT